MNQHVDEILDRYFDELGEWSADDARETVNELADHLGLDTIEMLANIRDELTKTYGPLTNPFEDDLPADEYEVKTVPAINMAEWFSIGWYNVLQYLIDNSAKHV